MNKLYNKNLQSSLFDFINRAKEATEQGSTLLEEFNLIRGLIAYAVDTLDLVKKKGETSPDKRAISTEILLAQKIIDWSEKLAILAERINKINRSTAINPQQLVIFLQQVLLILNEHVDRNTLAKVNTKLQELHIPMEDSTFMQNKIVLRHETDPEIGK